MMDKTMMLLLALAAAVAAMLLVKREEGPCTDCGEGDDAKGEKEGAKKGAKDAAKKGAKVNLAGETDAAKIKAGVQQTAVLAHPKGERDLNSKFMGPNIAQGLSGRSNEELLAMGKQNLKAGAPLSVPKPSSLDL